MAKKNNTKRKLVGLVSEESGIRAYYTKKNTMNTPDKLSLKKYDPVLRKHVLFTETKKNKEGMFVLHNNDLTYYYMFKNKENKK